MGPVVYARLHDKEKRRGSDEVGSVDFQVSVLVESVTLLRLQRQKGQASGTGGPGIRMVELQVRVA